MSAKPVIAHIIESQPVASLRTASSTVLLRAELLAVDGNGSLFVHTDDDREFRCDWLEGPATADIRLEAGDRLLVTPPVDGQTGVVLGRIGRYREPQPEARVTIEAGETLTLKCGESSVDLRADGRVMVRGQDVLLRAKGTQRIRAGTVAIN
jgi:hypothetical protein